MIILTTLIVLLLSSSSVCAMIVEGCYLLLHCSCPSEGVIIVFLCKGAPLLLVIAREVVARTQCFLLLAITIIASH